MFKLRESLLGIITLTLHCTAEYVMFSLLTLKIPKSRNSPLCSI